MLLLVTGASGAGKTTARRTLTPQLIPEVESAELCDLAPHPGVLDLRWRQRTTDIAVDRAVQLQGEGRHFLLCGDPVAAVEVAACPSSARLDAMACCLLDVSPAAQAERLEKRGDDPTLLVHHHAFAGWMRRQADDPTHMLEVVINNGWDAMCWDRIPGLIPRWAVRTIDTTGLDPLEVATHVRSWIAGALSGSERSFSPGLD